MSRFSFVFAFTILAAAACGGSSSAPHVTTTPVEPAPAASTCPMDVPGTSVTAEDTVTGGALIFVTTGDAADLRARVGAWAAAHNAHHGSMGDLPTGDETATGGAAGGEHHHHHGAHAGGGGGPAGTAAAPADFQTMISIHSRAAATDIDGGVRLELVTFPDQIGALRDELRGHVEHLSSMGCAMHMEP